MRVSRIAFKRIYVLIILGLLLTSFVALVYNIHPTSGGGSWWDSNWRYRKTLTIDHTKVSASLTNFPVLVSITDSDLASKAQSDGRDIAFTDSSLVKLDHEIESFNHDTGNLVAWVRANISSTVDTVLQMYYGNPSASSQQNPMGVWDSNYVMVQHLSETGNPTSNPAPWHQYEGNPILNGSTDGFGSVFYDSSSGLYHFYCSWGSILHYTSPNGKTGWIADPLNPMLTGNNEGVPTVWKEDGVWHMLYRYGGPDKVGLANSTDGSHWTRYEGNPVINVGQLDPWGLIKVGSTYYLWINDGFGGSGRGAELCTSTDLINWTQDTNAIFSGGRYCVSPFKYGAYYYMLVPLYTTGPYGVIELYRCSSPTFYASQRQYLGIVVPTGTAGSWNQYRHDTPCILTDTIYRDTFAASNNELWLYYASTPDSGGAWWTGMCIEQNMTDALTRFDPQAPTIIMDSTTNHNNGVPNGNMNMNISGEIDGGDSFDGSNDYINCGDNSTLKGMNALTVEIWIKPNAIGGSGAGVVAKWADWSHGSYIMFWGGSGSLGWGVINQAGSSGQISGGPTVAVGQWQHLVGVYDGAQVRLYRNGTLAGTPGSFSGTLMSENTPCYVGRYTTPYFNGIADEVRISNVSRSSSWITTEYNNQGSPSTFYSVGIEENSPSNYTLTVSEFGQGSVNLNATGPYNYGAVVQLIAVPTVGWSFQSWGVDLSGSTNPTTILIDGNKSVTATFTQNQYTLTVATVGSGSVGKNPDQATYTWGTNVTLTANASVGWNFAGWTGDASGTTNPTAVNMTGSKNVTATFTQDQYSLITSVVGGGSVTLNNSGPYHYGDAVKITAVPDAGWNFKYWGGDLSGSSNPVTLIMTGNMAVTANFAYPALFVSPSLVEKGVGDVGTIFDVQAKILDVKDLWGFDLQLNWDNTLLSLVNVDYNTTLDAVWGSGNWFVAESNNGSGFYKLVAVSTQYGFNSIGPQALATMTFRVEDPHSNFPLQTLLHFTTHKLSDSQANAIAHTVTDGTYRITGNGKPTLNLTPTAKTCREYGETFTIKINVSGVYNATDFEFEIDFNTTLLDYSNINWNAWGTGTLTVDEVGGKITGYTSGSMQSGDQTLITVEFKAAYYRIWRNLAGWANDQNGLILIQAANLSYSGSLKLHYVNGGLNEINVGPNVTYTFSPIQGDMDNNGTVDVFDLRTVAAFYDQQNPTYNLTGDPTIDIYDLVVIGANFGYTYVP